MTLQLRHIIDMWFSLQYLKQLSQSFKQAAVFVPRECDGKLKVTKFKESLACICFIIIFNNRIGFDVG